MIQRYIKLSDIKSNGKCLTCGKELPKKRRKYCSDNCLEEYYSRYWYGIFREKMIQEKGKCESCGERYVLEIHHKKPLSEGGELFNKENIEVLCWGCHKKKHKEMYYKKQEERTPLLLPDENVVYK